MAKVARTARVAKVARAPKVSKYDALQPEHIANVVNICQQATSAEWAAGMTWYPIYGQRVPERAIAAGLTANQGYALFAALSIQMPIYRNVKEYLNLLATQDALTIKHTDRVKATCAAILAGNVAALSGPKVTSFAANLAGDHNRVTVDRHALSMIYGENLMAVKGYPQYAYCERVIQAAAVVLNVLPDETQAIGWLVWRRLKGIIDKPADWSTPVPVSGK